MANPRTRRPPADLAPPEPRFYVLLATAKRRGWHLNAAAWRWQRQQWGARFVLTQGGRRHRAIVVISDSLDVIEEALEMDELGTPTDTRGGMEGQTGGRK